MQPAAPEFPKIISPFGYEQSGDTADHIGDLATGKSLAMPMISATLGSVGTELVDKHTDPDSRLVIPIHQLPHFPIPETQAGGHTGELIIAPVDDDPEVTMAIWSGRNHFYQKFFQEIDGEWNAVENWRDHIAAVGYYLAVLRRMGVHDVVTANAVGSLRPNLKDGDLVRVTDHVMALPHDFGIPEDKRWFEGHAKRFGADYDYAFTDYFYGGSNMYSPELGRVMESVSEEIFGEPLSEGVLAWVPGRGYETPSFSRFLANTADIVGMSTGPEAVRARSVGFTNMAEEPQFASISRVSNSAQFDHLMRLYHGEVDLVMKAHNERFTRFMHAFIQARVQQRLVVALADDPKQSPA